MGLLLISYVAVVFLQGACDVDKQDRIANNLRSIVNKKKKSEPLHSREANSGL